MKNKLLSIIVLVLFSCSEKKVNHTSLVERNDVMYEVNSQTPYTGKTTKAFENGQIEFNGSYKDGLLTGTWEYFKENGTKSHIIEFANGQKNGHFEQFNDSIGAKVYDCFYKNDSLHGDYKKFDRAGILREEGIYENGKKQDTWTFYQSNGSYKKENYTNDILDGKVFTYNKEDVLYSEGNYSKGKKNGVFKTYTDSGALDNSLEYVNDVITKEKKWNKNQIVVFEASYPGIGKWYDDTEKLIAEIEYISHSNANNKSLKILFEGKMMSPFNVLSDGVWKGKWHTNQDTGKQAQYKIMLKPNGEYFKMVQYPKDNYGRAMLGVGNEGTWGFDIYRLPKLYVEVNPKKYCNECEYEIQEITSLSSSSITMQGKQYTNVANFKD